MSKEIDAIFQDEASQDQEPKEQRQHTKGLKKSTFLGEDKLEIQRKQTNAASWSWENAQI